MIKANCGCYITQAKPPAIHLTCDEHVASSIYGGYDGKEDKICDYLIEQLTKRVRYCLDEGCNFKTTKNSQYIFHMKKQHGVNFE